MLEKIQSMGTADTRWLYTLGINTLQSRPGVRLRAWQ